MLLGFHQLPARACLQHRAANACKCAMPLNSIFPVCSNFLQQAPFQRRLIKLDACRSSMVPARANAHEYQASIQQIRIARPTDRLADLKHFYCEALGLREVASFQDHDGYTGSIIALPDRRCHLEFTQHSSGSACPAPSKDNLVVLYIESEQALLDIVEHLATLSILPVEPENPWWSNSVLSYTFEDPDGWRVVLCQGSGVETP